MKTLIEKIEALNVKNPQTREVFAYNECVKDILEILHSQPVIKAKAVRQKETGKWYYVSMDINRGWLTQSEFTMVDAFWLDSESFPADAELIDITIIVEE
jgi:hypothetical protein